MFRLLKLTVIPGKPSGYLLGVLLAFAAIACIVFFAAFFFNPAANHASQNNEFSKSAALPSRNPVFTASLNSIYFESQDSGANASATPTLSPEPCPSPCPLPCLSPCPSPEPCVEPSVEASATPSIEASAEPSPQPSLLPSVEPSASPSASLEPSVSPSVEAEDEEENAVEANAPLAGNESVNESVKSYFCTEQAPCSSFDGKPISSEDYPFLAKPLPEVVVERGASFEIDLNEYFSQSEEAAAHAARDGSGGLGGGSDVSSGSSEAGGSGERGGGSGELSFALSYPVHAFSANVGGDGVARFTVMNELNELSDAVARGEDGVEFEVVVHASDGVVESDESMLVRVARVVQGVELAGPKQASFDDTPVFELRASDAVVSVGGDSVAGEPEEAELKTEDVFGQADSELSVEAAGGAVSVGTPLSFSSESVFGGARSRLGYAKISFKKAGSVALSFKDLVGGLEFERVKKVFGGGAGGAGGARKALVKISRLKNAGGFKENSFKPGLKRVRAQVLRGGKLFVKEASFVWGVLAFNSNKNFYASGEEALLQMAVLDDEGGIVCDAALSLEVTAPDGSVTMLSTGNGGIVLNENCGDKARTLPADYEARYRASATGVYSVSLKAETRNGERFLQSKFFVRETAFDVERVTATRMFPWDKQTVLLKIKPESDFDGVVRERVPASFAITPQDGLLVTQSGGEKILEWRLAARAWEARELFYEYDAPDVSPALYLLGPLEINGATDSRGKKTAWSESREWMLAGDAADANLMLFWNGTSGDVPAGWTCVSCAGGDLYYDRFVVGGVNASTTGGSDGYHSHSYSIYMTTANASVLGDNGAADAGALTHVHGITGAGAFNSSTIYPPYKNLIVIRRDAAGSPSSLPAGVIGVFNGSVPSGWTRYSTQDGFYVRGGPNNTASSSALIHQHRSDVYYNDVPSVLAESGPGSHIDTGDAVHWHGEHWRRGYTDYYYANITHNNVVLAKLDAPASPPIGLIGMWNGSFSNARWYNVSGSGQPFNSKLLYGASAYSPGLGSSTHSHTQFSYTIGTTTDWEDTGNDLIVWWPTKDHTHSLVWWNIGSTSSDLPYYRTAIFMQYAAFPSPQFVSPTPSNASSTNYSYVYVNVSVDEACDNAILEWHYVNGSAANFSMSGSGTNFYYNATWFSNSGDGMHFFRAYANLSGSLNVTDDRYVNYDPPSVSRCRMLGVNGTSYVLQNSVYSTGSCFSVNASDVSLNCAGYTVNFSSVSVGYGVYGITPDAYGASNLTIANCAFNSSSAKLTGGATVFVNYVRNLTVVNNTGVLRNSGAYGVYCLFCYNSSFKNNSFSFPQSLYNSFHYGFEFSEAGSLVIQNNTVYSVLNNSYGFLVSSNALSNVSVLNNNFTIINSSSGYVATGIKSTPLTSASVVIANNSITSTGHGVYCSAGNTTVSENNVSSTNSSLYFTGACNASNNNVSSSSAHAIIFSGSSYANLTNNEVWAQGSYSGLSLSSASYSLAENNSFYGGSCSANLSGGTASNNVFRNNSFYSSGFCSSATTATGNSVQGNWFNSTPSLANASFTYSGSVVVNVTRSPPSDPTGYDNITKYVTASNSSANAWVFLNVSYADGELGSVNESTLRLWRYNSTSVWSQVSGSGVNAANNYVYGNISSFSVFAPLGQTGDSEKPTPYFGTNPVNNYNSSSSSVTFDFKCADNLAVDTIQLWTNKTGSWHADYSNSSYANNSWLNVTLTGFTDGWFVWGVWCNDSNGNDNWTASNRTLNVSLPATPRINFVPPTPDNNSIVQWQGSAYVNVSVTDASLGGAFVDWNRSLLGYWPMDFYNSTGVYDNSTFGAFAEFKGGLSASNITSGKFGSALEFNGTSHYLLTPVTFSQLTDGLTWEAWVKHYDFNENWNWIFGEDNAADQHSQFGTHPSGSLRFELQGVGTIDSIGFNASDHEWHHVAGVWTKGVGLAIYIDGSLNFSESLGSDLTATNKIRIGAKSSIIGSDSPWNGTIDEAKIWNRALTAEEINASFNNSAHRLERNFTGLSEGVYQYYAFATGSAGPQNKTGTRTLNVSSTPLVSFVPPTPDNASTRNVNWTYVNVSVTDSSPGGAFVDWNRSLAGYWAFDDFNGVQSTWKNEEDNSTWGNNGSINAGVFVSGKRGYGIKFAGGLCSLAQGCRMQVNDSASRHFNFNGSNSFSFEAWANFTTHSANQTLAAKGSTSAPSPFHFYVDVGAGLLWLFLNRSDGTVELFNASIIGDGAYNNWNYYAFTYDNGNVTLYVNGEPASSKIVGSQPYVLDGGQNFTLSWPSGETGGVSADMVVDEARMWARALTAAEIQASYNNSAYRVERNFTGLADGNYSFYGFATDASGNQNKTETRTVATEATTSCGTLSSNRTLLNSVSSSSTCFTVAAHNVALDCNGYSITYATGGTGYGVYNPGYENLTVANCSFVGSSGMVSSYGVYVKNTTIDCGGTDSICYGNGTLIANNSFTFAGDGNASVPCAGVFLNATQNITVYNNSFNVHHSSYGVWLLNADYNQNISNNTIVLNRVSSLDGILLSHSSFNNVSNNTILASNGVSGSAGINVNCSFDGSGGSLAACEGNAVSFNSITANADGYHGIKLFGAGAEGGETTSFARAAADVSAYSTLSVRPYELQIEWPLNGMGFDQNAPVCGAQLCLYNYGVGSGGAYDPATVYRVDDQSGWDESIDTVAYETQTLDYDSVVSFNNTNSDDWNCLDVTPQFLTDLQSRNAFFTVRLRNADLPYDKNLRLQDAPLWLGQTGGTRVFSMFDDRGGNSAGKPPVLHVTQCVLNSTLAENNTIIVNGNSSSGIYSRGKGNYFYNNSVTVTGAAAPAALSLIYENYSFVQDNLFRANGSDGETRNCVSMTSNNYITVANNNVSCAGLISNALTDASGFRNSFSSNFFSALNPDSAAVLLSSNAVFTANSITVYGSGTCLYAQESNYVDGLTVSGGSLGLNLAGSNSVLNNVSLALNGSLNGTGILWLSNDNSLTNATISNAALDVNAALVETSGNAVYNLTFNSSSRPTRASFTWSSALTINSSETPAGGEPPGYQTIGRFLNVTNASANAWVFLNVSYEESDLAGVNESQLVLLHRPAGGSWSALAGSGVDADNNYVFANQTSFSEDAPAAPNAGPYNVTLVSPANASWTNQSNVNFTFTVMDDVGVKNCTTTIWYANGTLLNETNWNSSAIANATVNGINYSFAADGAFLWNALCFDNTGQSNSSAENRTLFIDTAAPVAWLGVNPVANYNSTLATVFFELGCNDSGAIGNVSSLELWGSWGNAWHANASNASAVNGSVWNASVAGLTPGQLSWGAWCNDSAGNAAWSASNRTLYVHACGTLATNLTLANNVGAIGNCFIINASNLLLDCAGHVVNYSESSGGYGVYSRGFENVTVRNCSFNQTNAGVSGTGVEFGSNTNHSTIANCSFNFTGGEESTGFATSGFTSNLSVFGSVFYSSSYGATAVSLSRSSNARFRDVNASVANSSACVILSRAENNYFWNTTCFSGNGTGISVDNSSNNSFSNAGLHSSLDFSASNSVDVVGVNVTFNSSASSVVTASFTLYGNVTLNSSSAPAVDPSGYRNISKYLNVSNSSADSWVFLNVSYAQSDVQNAGVLEGALALWHYDAASAAWSQISGSGVDTANNYVFGNVTAFSDDAPFGPTDEVSVALNTPLNASWRASRNVNFTFTPSALNAFKNCTTLLWYSNGTLLNETNWNSSAIANASVNGINYTFATDGEYSWNVECTNNASVTNSSPLNYSLGIDSSTPAVTLVSPANGNVTNDSSTIAFKFNVTDETVSLLSCSLFLNDSLYASNSSVLNATLTAFSVSVANGNWTWNVSCADAAGNSNSSNRSIEVNVAASFTFSNVRVEDIRGTSAVVKFDTSVATTDWVWLSLYSNFSPSTNTSVNDTLSSTHSVVLSGLSFSTTYHYRACGADAYGAEACSSVGSFTTTGGGPQPTPTPSPSIEPSTEPSVEPSVEPSPTPSASPTPSVSVTPTPSVEPSVQPSVGPGEGGDETVVTVVGGSELSEGTGAVSECNSTVCRAGESAKVVVRRTIEVVQTPKGVLTRVKLRVSNEGKAAAFGVSVSEFVDSLAKGERVDYSLAPDSFFEGGAEWVIDVLPPGESREFAYAVFRRATLSEVGGSRPPVVFVRSAGAVSASLDYSLFYAAAALIAAAALARTALFFKQKREKRKKD